MWQRTMYSALLIITLFIASSASADSFSLADEILKMQAECDFYIKQIDNSILEGGETFPMNPGEDYFKCVEKLDNMKRQYITENLLGLSFYPEIFPMRLSNGTLTIVSAPAEDESSDVSNRYSDSNHLEEMCSIHESCSRILDNLNESIADKKSSEVNYYKIKRFYCLEILDKVKVRYIDDNHLNVDFLKAYGELSVMCKNGRTTMSLPESLKSEDNSRDLDGASSLQSKSSDSGSTSINNSNEIKDDSSSENVSYEGAYYNEIGLRIQPIISHNKEAMAKSIPSKNSLKTSQTASIIPEETVQRKEKIDSNNDRIGPEVSKAVETGKDEETMDGSVDTGFNLPEIDNNLTPIENGDPTSGKPTDNNKSVLLVEQDELENTSFYLKATATDFNFMSNIVTSPPKESDSENENSNSSDMKSNQDNNNYEKDKTDGIENTTSSDDVKDKTNEKLDQSDSKIRISDAREKNTNKVVENDKTVDNIDEKVITNIEEDQISNDNVKNSNVKSNDVTRTEKTGNIVENDKTVDNIDEKAITNIDEDKISKDNVKQSNGKSEDDTRTENNNDDKINIKGVNSNDNDKINKGNVIILLETQPSATDTSVNQKTDEAIENGVTVKSDSTIDKSDERLDSYNIDKSPGKAVISEDSAENQGGEVVSIEVPDDVISAVGQSAKSADKTNDNPDNNSSLRGSPPTESQLDHPPITTATPSPDTFGDELFEREEDCKQLLYLASRLLQYRPASYLDREYAACVEKLNQLKIQYIKSHSVDIDKFRILFPVALSDGTEKLIQLPPLHSESSTLPNTRSSAFPPHQPKTEQHDMFYDGDGLDDARVRHRSTNYVNRVRMENPAFIPNKKFLEYFNNEVPPGEASTLTKFANMIYRNVGLSEKKTEE